MNRFTAAVRRGPDGSTLEFYEISEAAFREVVSLLGIPRPHGALMVRLRIDDERSSFFWDRKFKKLSRKGRRR